MNFEEGNKIIDNIKFGQYSIGVNEPVFIIAEIGINHEGDVNHCAQMIEAAAKSGANSIKLQTVDADKSYTAGTESYSLFSKATLTRDETEKMFDLARSLNMEPFTTVGDIETLSWVDRLSPTAYKISSGLLTHIPLVKEVSKTNRPILLSTGMAETGDIDLAIGEIKKVSATDIALFQCTSLYPTEDKYLNLGTIAWMKQKYNLNVGFSDHSERIDASSYAVAAGACMIEKHFTYDSKRKDYDHSISLEPDAFKSMVKLIREAEVMKGTSEKNMPKPLIEQRNKYTRCLVANNDISSGEILTKNNIAIKRPNKSKRGLEPKFYDSVLGRKLKSSLHKDEPIIKNNIE
jgi:sialic acid synthase SpsE